jgi:protein SCO1/2
VTTSAGPVPATAAAGRARLALIALLALVAAIPLAALWGAFGPYAHRAPNFTLTDQNGRPFTLAAQIGRPVAMFFGYTHCPDECPLALAHFAQAMRSPAAPHDAEIVFITADPARDSGPVLRGYLRAFNPRFIGLTGSDPALAHVYADYFLSAKRLPPEAGAAGYAVEHGDTIFYVARDGSLKGFGNIDDSTETIVHALHDLG